jgi:hypothetical protein
MKALCRGYLLFRMRLSLTGQSLRQHSCIVVALLSIAMAASASSAGELTLESFSLRGGVSGSNVIGKEQHVDFQQVDVAMRALYPWKWDIGSGWIFRTRLLASAGVLRGADENNALFTFVPLDVSFGRKDDLIAIDMGVGGALLSDFKFGPQNMGGPFQFVWTFGVTSRFAGPFGAGYHFHHLSDATIYGSQSRGVDLHLFELIYWFDTAR